MVRNFAFCCRRFSRLSIMLHLIRKPFLTLWKTLSQRLQLNRYGCQCQLQPCVNIPPRHRRSFSVPVCLVPNSFHSKIIRYPDRSRQQQQGQQQGDRRSFSNYDPASAFRNSAAAEDRYNSAAANAASAEDLYGFSYDPNAPEDQSRGRNDNGGERRRQRPEQDYPRRNASNSGYNKEMRNLQCW